MKFPLGEGGTLVRLYYALRQALGLEAVSQERLRKQHLLQPQEDAWQVLRQEDEQRLRQVLLCLGVVMLLSLVSWFHGRDSTRSTLVRPGYGESDREIILEVECKDEQYEIPLKLRSLQYTEDEVEARLEEAWELVCEAALGENPDWEHVSQDLNLVTESGIPGIQVSWVSSDGGWISSGGTVHEVASEGEAPVVVLTATLSYEGIWREEQIRVHLVPPSHTKEELRQLGLQDYLNQVLENRQEEEVTLPEQWEGDAVRYPAETNSSTWIYPMLGLLAAAAMWLIPEQRRKEAIEKRERELEIAYSELIWKLTVLLGAGLTVRSAWERIVLSYRKDLEKGGTRSILYEEMQITWNSLSQGVYEEKAYAEFGRRCGLPSYLRLGSLLETNVRQGRKGLLGQMQSEAEEAFRSRLQLAKRQGEEASSKLLLPMMLLFALVLGILMLPAMFSFRL